MKKELISSKQNPQIKNLLKLIQKKKERHLQNVFVVEGVQENTLALASDYEPISFYICEDILQNPIKLPPVNQLFITSEVYASVAYRQKTEGIIGVYTQKHTALEDFHPNSSCKIIVLEGIEKPGNLGAVLRSTEAFGIDMVIVTNSDIDVYNPNVIRSSMGSFFHQPLIQTQNEDVRDFLLKKGVTLYATHMHHQAKKLSEVTFSERSAIIFGEEHQGMSDFWMQQNIENIIIPMKGKIDSLNLSNSVAIICYSLS